MRKTFKNFLSKVKPFEEIDGVLPENLNEMTWEQKLRSMRLSANKKVLSVKEDSIYFVQYQLYVHRIGKNFFKDSIKSQFIYIDSKDTNIKCGPEFIMKFLHLCNIDWCRDIPQVVTDRYFNKPSILKSILIGTIYNEETLYKAIARRLFHCKDISWRNMREYCQLAAYDMISFIDLMAFTKNINVSITTYVNSSNKQLYRDLLTYAVSNNQTIDFNWSANRLNAEHQKQIRLANAKEISSKKQKPIYDLNFKLPDNIKLLNTEKDIYLEGLNMSHCLYRCYFSQINVHEYIAFHMTEPEDCTFSFRKIHDKVVLDQIYLKYDRLVREETKDVAIQFLKDNYDNINEMFKQAIKIEILLDNDVDLLF